MDRTIKRLQDRIKHIPAVSCVTYPIASSVPSPISFDEFDRFESNNGLVLPRFVRRLYTEVADGGFGPAYGVNSLARDRTDSIANWDRMFQAANQEDPTGPQWPRYLLRFCELGCNMFYALDIRDDEGPIYKVEISDSNAVSEWLDLTASSVCRWLDEWAQEPIKY